MLKRHVNLDGPAELSILFKFPPQSFQSQSTAPSSTQVLKSKNQGSSLSSSLCHLTHKPWWLYLFISPSPRPTLRLSPKPLRQLVIRPPCSHSCSHRKRLLLSLLHSAASKGFSQSMSHHMLPHLKTHQWLFISTQ